MVDLAARIIESVESRWAKDKQVPLPIDAGQYVLEKRLKVSQLLRRVRQQKKLRQCKLAFTKNAEAGRQGFACVTFSNDRRRKRMQGACPRSEDGDRP